MDKIKHQQEINHLNTNQKISNVNDENHSDAVVALLTHLDMKMKKKEKKELKYRKIYGELIQNLKIQAINVKQDHENSEKEILCLQSKLVSLTKENEKLMEENRRLKESKIEFRNEISKLQYNLSNIKEEKFVVESTLERKVRILEQKCEEFIDMMITKKKGRNTRSNEPAGDYCCGGASFKNGVLQLLQEEFSCCICDEILVEATLTKCNHTFCARCLKESKKRNRTCPVCRTDKVNERRVAFVDKFITNVMKLLSDELYAGRMQLVEDRKSPVYGTPSAGDSSSPAQEKI